MCQKDEKIDYGKTLNLPKTEFSMRGNLPQKEPNFLKFWEENNIYEKSLKNKEKDFILHDGPPYANGEIHIGHALNKILKDIVLKFKRLDGYNAPYIPGWDTHGLPIELKVGEQLGSKIKEMDKIQIRNKCKDYALKFVKKQKNGFKRLGVLGEWEKPYLTLNPEYEAMQLEVFKELYLNGYIFKGLKPIHWCPSCHTALAEAEIEYADHKAPSIFVKFNLLDKYLSKFNIKDLSLVIWTTTPWTLPGNIAICLNSKFEYSILKTDKGNILIATELIESALKDMEISKYEILKENILGLELEKMECKHPFLNRNSTIILGDHVTLEAGTGCVHTAPGHGQEDYVACTKYKLPIVSPVDYKGVLTSEAGEFEGVFYKKANKLIIEKLIEINALITTKEISHSYPHCWRCKKPVIFRATEQWFVKVEGSDIRQKAIKSLENVDFTPSWGINRIKTMLESRPDWCISRQRTWGVPIPVFYCNDCDKEVYNENIANEVITKVREGGTNLWLKLSPNELAGDYAKCSCGSTNLRKETNIMDVWFDSGVSHRSVLETRENLHWPADLYLEGSDQHRGWFQTSLLTSVGTRNTAPYKQVLTHGFVNDGNGKKMSKSTGNVVSPDEIIKKYGADILRLWCASIDYREDVKISENIVKQIAEAYRRIRNTLRYILGNLKDFDYENDKISYENLNDLDKFALHKLEKLKEEADLNYREYKFYNLFNDIHYFMSVDMSAFYLDIVKDRLYVSNASDLNRRSTQTVMAEILLAITKIISPVLAFTAEEVWQNIPKNIRKTESVLLSEWIKLNKKNINNEIFYIWNTILEVRSLVNSKIEIQRKEKIVGHSLDCKVVLTIGKDSKYYNAIYKYQKELKDIFIVSANENIFVGNDIFEIEIMKASGEKCERCWQYFEDLNTKHLCKRCVEVLQTSI